MPFVSVIIPCYNASAYIKETLDSVFGQKNIDLEVIVVDDGSTDNSAAIVRSAYPQVRLIETPNQGPSAARNLGTSHASADLIQYLDSDDILAPGKLAMQAAVLEKPDADIVYGDWIRFRTGPAGEKVELETISRQLGSQPDIDLFTSDFWCPPAVYLMRRSIVEKVGPWHPRLPVIQDARFMLDCSLQGARFVRSGGLAAYYRVHQDGSVSTRSRSKFLRDCLLNAKEMYEFWRDRGMLDADHRKAIARACDHVVVGSLESDPETFPAACDLVAQAMPGYKPEHPWKRRVAASLLGYERSVSFAHGLRKWKAAVR